MGGEQVLRAVLSVRTPIQALVFVAALALIVLSRSRYKKYSKMIEGIRGLPANAQVQLIAADLGKPVPPTVSAQQFLSYTRQRYVFLLAFSTLIAATTVVLFTRALVSNQTVSIGTNDGTLYIDNGRSAPAPSAR